MKLNFDPVTQDLPEGDGKYLPTTRTFTIDSHGSKLLGSILIASGEPIHPTVIMLNGFPGNETNMDIAHSIRRAGFNVVQFHFRGSWGSEGNYSWQNSLEDTENIINHFCSEDSADLYRCDPKKLILIGHSMGGFISLMKAAEHSSINYAGSFAGFNLGLWGDFVKENEEIKLISLERMRESVELIKGTSAETLLEEMINNHEQWNLVNRVENLSKKNLLLIAAKYDQIAPVELHHKPLVNVIKRMNSNITEKIISTGHTFSDKRIELTREIINWLTNIE